MSLIIKGKVILLNMDNISTDEIYPASYLNLSDPKEIAEYVLTGIDPHIHNRLLGSILVVGNNFGCGSSREQAVIGLKAAGLQAVIAGSVGRIWYRNAINLALPVLIRPEIVHEFKEDDVITINLEDSTIRKVEDGKIFLSEPISEFVLNIIRNGGIKSMMKRKYA